MIKKIKRIIFKSDLPSTPETNTTFQVNYISIKKKEIQKLK